MTTVKVTALNINGAPIEGENPLPIFRDRQHNKVVNFIEPFPEEKKLKGRIRNGFQDITLPHAGSFFQKTHTDAI